MRCARSVLPMKIAKTGYMAISLVLCVLGVLMITVPGLSFHVFDILCGAFMTAFGAIRLTGFFSKDLYRLAFQYDLAFGILMSALGVSILINSERAIEIICPALGLSILADGIFKAQTAIDAKKFGIRVWWLIFTFAAAAGISGLILSFQTGMGGRLQAVLPGVALFFEGILNFTTAITAVKIIEHQMPDNIDIDYEESED